MSNFEYDPVAASATMGNEESIYLSSSDEDENITKYTEAVADGPEPISDDGGEDEDGDEDEEEDEDEDSYIPTAKSSLSGQHSDDESDHSDTDFDGYGGDGHRRPIKVYDEYDPENLDEEESPNAKLYAMRRGPSRIAKTFHSILSLNKAYQVTFHATLILQGFRSLKKVKCLINLFRRKVKMKKV